MFLIDGGVPPPTQIAVICPSAVKVAVPPPIAVPKSLATDPAKEMPEKPDPSKPQLQAGKRPNLTLKFKSGSEAIVNEPPPKKEVAPEVSKKPSKGKGDITVISIQKPLNSRYRCNLIVDGIPGP